VNTEFDWKAWRHAERRARIAAREALEIADRKGRNAAIEQSLRAGFSALGGALVGFCWPFRGEPDPRFVIRDWRAAGGRAALPVVVAPRTPLEFREWWPGVRMEIGVYDIPFPAETAVVEPEAALVPVNGFDAEGYRLGYGGGYFDRTLASLSRSPVCVGLGYEIARLETIHPQAHDIPFDFMVTEAGIHARIDGELRVVTATEADALVRRLRGERGRG